MNLDDVPKGTPCPTCGSHRRDAIVSPPTIAAIGHVFAPNVISTDEDDQATIVVVGQAVNLSVTSGVEAYLAGSNADAEVWDRTWRRMDELALGTTVRTVVFHDPGDGGVVVCEARDDDGNVLDAKPGVDAIDALLNAAEALAPTPPDG